MYVVRIFHYIFWIEKLKLWMWKSYRVCNHSRHITMPGFSAPISNSLRIYRTHAPHLSAFHLLPVLYVFVTFKWWIWYTVFNGSRECGVESSSSFLRASTFPSFGALDHLSRFKKIMKIMTGTPKMHCAWVSLIPVQWLNCRILHESCASYKS